MLGYFGFFMPWDWLLLPGLLLGLLAQMRLMATYQRHLRQPVSTGLSGAETARIILDRAGLHDVPVEPVRGQLTDHYDPLKRALFLSEANYAGRSISAVGVAAHEAGHALQHQAAYAPLQLRMMLVPATNFATRAFFLIFVGGLLLTMFGMIHPQLFARILPFAIGAYAVVTLFQLVTLPVEYDASRRAREVLLRFGLIGGHETEAVSRVLSAAALTYVAALISSVLELLRLIMIARSFADD
ncbi:MAG: zinc metallopeptidase [Verrucomicrobiales bacterium]|nr:zinc metallopeptidase [Verrucomicrobiales bacterium]